MKDALYLPYNGSVPYDGYVDELLGRHPGLEEADSLSGEAWRGVNTARHTAASKLYAFCTEAEKLDVPVGVVGRVNARGNLTLGFDTPGHEHTGELWRPIVLEGLFGGWSRPQNELVWIKGFKSLGRYDAQGQGPSALLLNAIASLVEELTGPRGAVRLVDRPLIEVLERPDGEGLKGEIRIVGGTDVQLPYKDALRSLYDKENCRTSKRVDWMGGENS